MKRILWLAALSLYGPSISSARAAEALPSRAKIDIDARKIIGEVNPHLFGHNVEAGDPQGIFGKERRPSVTQTGTGLWNPQTRAPVAALLSEAKTVGMKMMRYPGGCLAHNFDWKKAVGPIATRPDFAFGIDEYIAWCRAAGAEPLMNVSDYAATPQDAADLVEYLNAPADDKHPWAKKRAAWGHAKPYGVKYFEMGNETDHGNHDVLPKKKWTATEYVAWYNGCSRKMRAIDAKIKMGALMGTGTGPDDPWNETVLSGTRGRADFIVVHTYAVGVWAPDEPAGGYTPGSLVMQPADKLMRACMAAIEQTEVLLSKYRERIRRFAGRAVPLAITEYNASFVQEKPIPYRFAYGPALFSADYLRALMQPQSNVAMANYWQIFNGYWGMLQANDNTLQRNPAYFLYRLWGQHFGTRLVQTTVASPRVEFEGLTDRVVAARGDKYRAEKRATANLLAGVTLQPATETGVRTEVLEGGVLRATVTDLQGEKFPSIATLPAPMESGFVLSFEARSSGNFDGTNLGLGLSDTRGWDATRSALGVEGVESAADWKPFEGRFRTLADAPGASLVWRLRAPQNREVGAAPIAGTIEIRNLRIVSWQSEQFPAYAAITATSSLSRDRSKLYLMVFNKHHEDAIPVSISVKNFATTQARRWSVTGPSLDALNRDDEPGKTSVRETEIGVAMTLAHGKVLWTAPPRSMTAIEIQRFQPARSRIPVAIGAARRR